MMDNSVIFVGPYGGEGLYPQSCRGTPLHMHHVKSWSSKKSVHDVKINSTSIPKAHCKHCRGVPTDAFEHRVGCC